MTETLTIPAHVENGSLLLDAPLPAGTVRVEVRATVESPPSGNAESILEYLRTLPPGAKTGDELDAQLREIRDAW
jgi:hypothetical protein